jgi:hypothetical protein
LDKINERKLKKKWKDIIKKYLETSLSNSSLGMFNNSNIGENKSFINYPSNSYYYNELNTMNSTNINQNSMYYPQEQLNLGSRVSKKYKTSKD